MTNSTSAPKPAAPKPVQSREELLELLNRAAARNDSTLASTVKRKA